MNLDETVMMVRAICSSEKGPTQIRQLSSKYLFILTKRLLIDNFI